MSRMTPIHQVPSHTLHLPRQKALSIAIRLLCGTLLAGSVAYAPAWAQGAAVQEAKQYAIPAGSLDQVLGRFGREAGVMIAIDPELSAGLRSEGLSGRYSLAAGLNSILAPHKLEAVPGTNGGYRLRRMTGGAAVLPEVKVTAGLENAWGAVPGYVAKRTATATKTDTPIIETPQSITVASAEQMEAQKAQNITEALSYSAGVVRSEDLDSTRDQMRVRGFDLDAEYGSYFRDGMKYSVNGFNGQQELYGLERVELLRGASSVLYGLSAPGGLVNSVSKRPTTDRLRELNVEVGSFNRKQVSGDFGGKLSEDGEWSYRLTGLYRDSDTFIDHRPDDRVYIAPALKWQPSAMTSVTLLAEYQRDKSMYNNGLPQSGTLLSNPNGKIPRNRFLGEPGFDRYDNTRYSVGYIVEHGFNDALKLRHSLRYFDSQNDYASTGVSAFLAADQRTVGRDASKRHDESSSVTTDTSLQYLWGNESVSHTSLVGFDYTRANHQTERYAATASPIDVFNPVYGAPMGPLVYQPWSYKTKTNRVGAYIQDQMKINGKWVVALGGRYDRVKDDICALSDPSTCSVNDEKSSAKTGRVGLVYLADNGLAPFASYSTSWEPVTGFDRTGKRYEPTTGDQYELGIRYQPKDSNTLLSAAVYQLTRQNVGVTDPVDMTRQIQIGEQRSRGLELEAKTSIGRYANLIAAYAYTDAKTLKSSPLTPELEGKRKGGVPYSQMSVWADYNFGAFGLAGVKVGGGARYVGSTVGIWTDLETPSYTLFDAMASYTTGPWRLALNATNLADKNYVALCPYRCFYGEPRKVLLTATYRW